MGMAITANLLEAFLKCRTKCFLRARGEVETDNTHANWVRSKNEAFRCEGIRRLVGGAATDNGATAKESTDSGRLGHLDLVPDYTAKSENLQSCCHAVERIPSAGQGRTAQFVPIRFVFSDKVTRHDKLLLAFDALILSKMLGRKVTFGRIVHGDDYTSR